MGANLKLPDGPPSIRITVSFSEREIEFIHLRYEKCLTIKEIVEEMKTSLRTVKWYSTQILMRLGVRGYDGEKSCSQIQATKRLLILGYIKLEDSE
jgi:DNA-binding NarL/FixJ family response regulator